eukprot:CAMPEP_0177680306 /NCGR_PEP_ID=MMETSP0447-20121125/30101_1 /TAXON_ID=0 /ORGANISM="Stygamoeba regulata, Strain BSH-02190019" /LENGTH=977 /DNA_ID=CAMNT_0019189625 /DNA_START=336 /DNA_END=3269 /DNA_ORIENTATION=-
MDFFDDLERLAQVYAARGGDGKQHHKSINANKSDFKKRMEAILANPYKERGWSEIFHGRMISFQNILSSEQICSYYTLFEAYVQLFPDQKKLKKKEQQLVSTAKDLMDYIDKHRIDPDNSLIGLSPAKSVLEKYCYPYASSRKEFETVQELEPADRTVDGLQMRILKWGAINDPATLMKEVKLFAARLHADSTIAVGDLVMALVQADKTPKEMANAQGVKKPEKSGKRWMYCRVYRVLEKCIVIHCSPDESRSKSVPIEDVVPFHTEMKLMIGRVKSMQSLVEDPVDVLYSRVKRHIRECIKACLQEENIDYEILRKTKSESVALHEQKILRDIKDRLLKLLDRTLPFYGEMERTTSVEVQEFLSSMDPMKLFSPTREAQFRELRDLPVEEFTRNRVQYFLMNVDSNNDRLNLERKKLTNGDRKRDMTNWWLTHIEESVDKFLEQLGYKHDAVPRDYLAKPPRNLDEVEKNLKIVTTCLDRTADVYSVQEFVKKLRAEIYVVIDDFVDKIKFLVSERVGRDLEDIADYEKLLEDLKAEEDTHGSTCDDSSRQPAWLDECIKDIMYITEMKSLEEMDATKNQQLKMSKVVPVTGLIFGRFHRLENEMSTVLEMWGGATLARKETTMSRTLADYQKLQEFVGRAQKGDTEPDHSDKEEEEDSENLVASTSGVDGAQPEGNVGAIATDDGALPASAAQPTAERRGSENAIAAVQSAQGDASVPAAASSVDESSVDQESSSKKSEADLGEEQANDSEEDDDSDGVYDTDSDDPEQRKTPPQSTGPSADEPAQPVAEDAARNESQSESACEVVAVVNAEELSEAEWSSSCGEAPSVETAAVSTSAATGTSDTSTPTAAEVHEEDAISSTSAPEVSATVLQDAEQPASGSQSARLPISEAQGSPVPSLMRLERIRANSERAGASDADPPNPLASSWSSSSPELSSPKGHSSRRRTVLGGLGLKKGKKDKDNKDKEGKDKKKKK